MEERIRLGWLYIFLFWKREKKGEPTKKDALIVEYIALLHELDLVISVEEKAIENAQNYPKESSARSLQRHKEKLTLLRDKVRPDVEMLFCSINGKPEDHDFYAEDPLCFRVAELLRRRINIHF